MAVFTVLGAGMMGTALCVPLRDRGHEVRLVGTHLDRAIIAQLRAQGTHPGVAAPLPAGMRFFDCEELPAAMEGADALALGVSSAGVRWAADQVAPLLSPDTPVISIAKGLEWDGQRLVTLPEVLAQRWPARLQAVAPVAVAGPCIAGELARRVETAVVLTGRDPAVLDRFAAWLATDYYFLRTSTDVAGVEVCAALKNAFAMSIGFAAGLHERRGGQPGSVAMHNYEAAVYTQAALEMARLVALVGGQPDAIWGLAGIGDLLVTCSGGRTSRLGRWLGLGLSLEDAVAQMNGATLESLDILKVLASALPTLEAQGALRADELPLLRHLIGVTTCGEPVSLPFGRFF
jgi:glycerol-3-phosphate dehydrogenase (NAD(P)+)